MASRAPAAGHPRAVHLAGYNRTACLPAPADADGSKISRKATPRGDCTCITRRLVRRIHTFDVVAHSATSAMPRLCVANNLCAAAAGERPSRKSVRSKLASIPFRTGSSLVVSFPWKLYRTRCLGVEALDAACRRYRALGNNYVLVLVAVSQMCERCRAAAGLQPEGARTWQWHLANMKQISTYKRSCRCL